MSDKWPHTHTRTPANTQNIKSFAPHKTQIVSLCGHTVMILMWFFVRAGCWFFGISNSKESSSQASIQHLKRRKKRAQKDDVIKREPVKSQTIKKNVKIMFVSSKLSDFVNIMIHSANLFPLLCWILPFSIHHLFHLCQDFFSSIFRFVFRIFFSPYSSFSYSANNFDWIVTLNPRHKLTSYL